PVEEVVSCRRGRRQSEPTKQILKSLVQSVSLKHAGSDGELLGNKDSLNSLTGVSTVGSSKTEPEGERDDIEDNLAHSKDSLELQNASDSEEMARGTEFVQEGVEPEEELMIEGDQTEDPVELQEVKGCKRQNSQPSGNAEKRRGWDSDSNVSEEVASVLEPISLQQMVTEACHSALQEIQSDSETACSTDEPKGADGSTEDTEAEGSDSGRGVMEPTMEYSFNEPGEEPKHLSSEDSTDEDEQDRESRSILPPSVLGQASLIAGRFINSRSRRNSLAADDSRSCGCSTPKTTSRQSSLERGDKSPWNGGASGTSDDSQASIRQANVSQEKHLDEPRLSSPEDAPLETDRNVPRRRDSTLSRQDRLLIEKIKSYYDNAEHKDANFSIRRRESLSYIPAGLVRSSISKLNSQNREEDLREATLRRRLAASSTAAGGPLPHALSDLPDPNTQPGSHSPSPESGAPPPARDGPAEDSLPLDFSRGADPVSQDPITDAEFQPSANMVKVWQEMERVADAAAEPPKRTEQRLESMRRPEVFEPIPEMLKKREAANTERCQIKQLSNGRIIFGLDFNEPLVIVEDSDLSAIKEESPLSSPVRFTHECGLQRRPSEKSQRGDREHADEVLPIQTSDPLAQAPLCVQPAKCSGPENKTSPPQPPDTRSSLTVKKQDQPARGTRAPVAQAGSRAQSEELLREVTEKMKTRVYQLARIYSQRIKNNKPVVQKRSQHIEEEPMSSEKEVGSELAKVPHLQKDKKDMVVGADKSKMALSMPFYEHVIIQEQVPLTPLMEEPNTPPLSKELQSILPSSSRIPSPRRSVISPNLTSPARSHSRSPLSPTEMETFLWPDVRELCSKYAAVDARFARNSAQRPVRMTESGCPKLTRVAKSMSMPNGMMEGRLSHASSLEQEDNSKAGYCPSSAKSQPLKAASSTGARKQLHSDSSIQYLVQATPESPLRNHTNCSRTALSDCRCTEQSSSSNCKHCHFMKGTEGTHYVSSEFTVQDQQVIIMEKLPCDGDDLSSHRNEQTTKESSSGGEGYVQIRSPTSRENISIQAVVERCRAYQESEEYKIRQETEAKSWRPGNAKMRAPAGAEKKVSSTKRQAEPRKEMSQLHRRTDLGQQGLVKNLRDKFQSLSSAR
ncbi:pleckstrin homology domain-containing family G member 3-like, partial [Rhincodon typus]|uniref:pleckstrin homology domain-containing family G member 3-like n=1 Tax=Rhincodon typus TaxID=259920 RepID=UPI00202DCD1A